LTENEEQTVLVDKLANSLRARIEGGEFGTTGIIPSLSELAQEWEVSRTFAAEVIMILRAQGYLVQTPKRRYRVVHPRIVLPGLTPNFRKYLEGLGFTTEETDIQPPKVEPMPLEIAKLFTRTDNNEPAIREGVHVVHRVRRQGVTDLPLRIGHIWYPSAIAQPYMDAIKNDSSFDMLAALKRDRNIAVVDTDFSICCRIPDQVEMKELNLARFQPVLEARRIGYTAGRQQVITLHRTIMDGTRFEYQMKLPVSFWK